MKRIQRILRLVALAIMLFLAMLGIGLVGGVPLTRNTKKEDRIEFRIEKKDSDEETDSPEKADKN